MVPHASVAITGLSDAGFRAWIALDRWAYRGAFPTNAELAAACGWLSDDGKPATRKAVRVLAELENLGLVRRVTDRSHGHWRRVGIDVIRPQEWAAMNGQTGMTRMTYPLPHQRQGGMSDLSPTLKRETEIPIDRSSNPERGGDRPTEPVEVEAIVEAQARKTAPKVSESDVEAKGKAIHARLYEGCSPAIAAGDWRQWERAYCGVSRDLLSGRLTPEQVNEAVVIGRREDSRRRGARFLGTIRSIRAGRPPGGVARPDSAPAATRTPDPVGRTVKPPLDEPPQLRRLPGEPIGSFCRRLAEQADRL